MLLRLLVVALLPLTSALVYDLTEDNFERLVFRPSSAAGAPARVSFVKFYAPWCGHCQKLAPDWKKVEKAHDSSASLLVGSVDCSDGPEGRNPLCDKYRAMSLPTLMSFHPPSRKGSTYEGNKTAADLLAFATELSSECALAALEACTEEQKAWLSEYDALPVEDLKSKVQELDAAAEMAKMQMMMVQMQMQQTFQDKQLSQEAKDAKMKEFETEAKAASEKIDASWKESASLRAMKIVLRAKAPVDPEDEFDMMDMMRGRGGARGAGRGAPKKPKAGKAKETPKKEKKKKKRASGPCEDKGPWPCTEEGCPSPSVACKHLTADCKKKFSSVFQKPPEGLADKKVWQLCRKTCDKCPMDTEKDEV